MIATVNADPGYFVYHKMETSTSPNGGVCGTLSVTFEWYYDSYGDLLNYDYAVANLNTNGCPIGEIDSFTITNYGNYFLVSSNAYVSTGWPCYRSYQLYVNFYAYYDGAYSSHNYVTDLGNACL